MTSLSKPSSPSHVPILTSIPVLHSGITAVSSVPWIKILFMQISDKFQEDLKGPVVADSVIVGAKIDIYMTNKCMTCEP